MTARMVRLDRMHEEGLDADQMISALALAINDLGIVMALQVIHGERAPRVYADHGGMVRFDAGGNVMVPVPDDPPADDEPTAAEALRAARERGNLR